MLDANYTQEEGEPTSETSFQRGDQARAQHNDKQKTMFDNLADEFLRPLPEDVLTRLARIAAAVQVRHGHAVLDVGSGTGVLLSYILRSSPARVVACDLSEEMLKRARAQFSDKVLFIQGDVVDLPAEIGPFDRIICNGVFGNFFNQHQVLLAIRRLLKPHGRLIISHPMGRAWVRRLMRRSPEMVLHEHPDEPQLNSMCAATGFRLMSLVDEPDLYIAVLGVEGRK